MPFWDIIGCDLIEAGRGGRGACADVVRAQKDAGHVPEPWVGHLRTATLLFISSNPGFDANEHFPTAAWSAAATEEFFTDRFTAGDPPYVNRFRVRQAAGGYARRAPQYWTEAHRCAAELLDRNPADVTPGTDYALTEVVHCKSPGNTGTASACRTCADRFLRRVLEASASRVVVCYGDTVWPETRRLFGAPPRPPPESRVALHGPAFVEGHDRMFLFLPQPGSARSRRPTQVLPPEQLAAIRSFLKEGRNG